MRKHSRMVFGRNWQTVLFRQQRCYELFFLEAMIHYVFCCLAQRTSELYRQRSSLQQLEKEMVQNLFVNAPFNLSGKSRNLKNAATCDRNRHSKYNPKYMKHWPERQNQSRAADMNIRSVWSDEEWVISHQTNRTVIFKWSFSRGDSFNCLGFNRPQV